MSFCDCFFIYVLHLYLVLFASLQPKESQDVLSPNSALIIVDIQKDYYSRHSTVKQTFPDFETNIVWLLSSARLFAANNQLRIVHLREKDTAEESVWRNWWGEMNGHAPHLANGTSEEFCKILHDEKLITKHSWDGFFKTELDDYLTSNNIDTLYLSGISTYQCVANTAMSAFNFGYKVHIISDCCASDNVIFHNNILDILDENMVKVINLETFTMTFNSTNNEQ